MRPFSLSKADRELAPARGRALDVAKCIKAIVAVLLPDVVGRLALPLYTASLLTALLPSNSSPIPSQGTATQGARVTPANQRYIDVTTQDLAVCFE